jgi:hypothetical protein
MKYEEKRQHGRKWPVRNISDMDIKELDVIL